jgi:hypothetical protein
MNRLKLDENLQQNLTPIFQKGLFAHLLLLSYIKNAMDTLRGVILMDLIRRYQIYLTISLYKSCHSELFFSIKSSFHFLGHFFKFFSRVSA